MQINLIITLLCKFPSVELFYTRIQSTIVFRLSPLPKFLKTEMLCVSVSLRLLFVYILEALRWPQIRLARFSLYDTMLLNVEDERD